MDAFETYILELFAKLPQDELRVAADIAKRADKVAAHERRWIQELVLVVDSFNQLGTRTPWPLFHLLWLRLHGVFTELLDTHRMWAQLSARHRPSYANYAAAIYEAAHSMLRALSEEEHVGADYFRQRTARLQQSAYTVRFARGRSPADTRRSGKPSKTIDTRKIDHIEKTFTIEEVDRILRDLMNKFGNEVEFAVHIARVVRPHVLALSAREDALHQLPPTL